MTTVSAYRRVGITVRPAPDLVPLPPRFRVRVSNPRLVGMVRREIAEYARLTADDWTLIKPYLDRNEHLFGIPVDRLLDVDGIRRRPEHIYHKIQPLPRQAPPPEEAWGHPQGARLRGSVHETHRELPHGRRLRCKSISCG